MVWHVWMGVVVQQRWSRTSWGRSQRWLAATALCVFIGVVLVAAAAASTPGTLDPSFGMGGVSYDQFGLSTPADSGASSVVVAPGGDIYVGGGMTGDSTTTQEVFVARYTPAGVLDPSFGNGGVVVVNVGLGSSPQTGEGWASFGTLPMAVTPDGNVIVATTATDSSDDDELAVVELTSAGLLNPAFASGGVYRSQLSSASVPHTWGLGLALQADGRPVITGAFRTSGGGNEFFAERLTTAGAPDASFDATSSVPGVYEHQYGQGTSPQSFAQSVIAETDGNLTFAGTATDANGDQRFLVLRLTAAGTPDPAFGATFAQPSDDTGNPESNGIGLVETPAGRYIVGGLAYDPNGEPAVAAAEFNSDGSLAAGFASSGVYLQQLSPVSGGLSQAFGVALQPDGKIDLVGAVYGSEGNTGQTAIVRLSPSGTLDPSFGTGGVLESQLATGGPPISQAYAGAIEPNGDLLLAGKVSTPTSGEERAFLAAVVTDSAPTVTISASPSPQTGQSVTFTANATPAGGASISSYAWDLGSGGFTDATGSVASKTFNSPGTYSVRVQVTDSDGLSTISSQTVTVTAPPAATTTTTTTTTPQPAPAPKLRIGPAVATKTGVAIKLTCASAACRGTIGLSAVEHLAHGKVVAVTAKAVRQRTVKVRLGSVRYTLAAGTSKALAIPLNSTGRRILAQRHRLALTVTVTLSDAKPATVTTRRVTLIASVTRRRSVPKGRQRSQQVQDTAGPVDDDVRLLTDGGRAVL